LLVTPIGMLLWRVRVAFDRGEELPFDIQVVTLWLVSKSAQMGTLAQSCINFFLNLLALNWHLHFSFTNILLEQVDWEAGPEGLVESEGIHNIQDLLKDVSTNLHYPLT